MNQRERLALGFLAVGVLYLVYKVHEVIQETNALDYVVSEWMKQEKQAEYDEEFDDIVDESLRDLDL